MTAAMKLANAQARTKLKAAAVALQSADSTRDLSATVAHMRQAVESIKLTLSIIEGGLPPKRKAPAKKAAAKKASK